MTIAWSPTCLNAAYDPRANPAFTGTPFTVTLRSVRGMPMRKTSPGCICPDLPRACSTAFQSGPAARTAVGIPTLTINPRNATAYLIGRSLITALSLVELLRHRLPFFALHQRHVGHGVAILQRRHDADDAVPLVLLHGLGGSGIERPLGLRHRFALSLGVCEIVSLGDRLCFRDLAGLVVDDHLGELVAALHRVKGQLELAVLDLVLRGNRLAFLRARREAALKGNLGVPQGLRQLGVLLVLRRLRPACRNSKGPRHEERQHDRRRFHGASPGLSVVW